MDNDYFLNKTNEIVNKKPNRKERFDLDNDHE